MRRLLRKEAFTAELEKDVLVRASFLGGRFVLSIKQAGTNGKLYKAWLFVHIHTDTKNYMTVHNSTNIKNLFPGLLV